MRRNVFYALYKAHMGTHEKLVKTVLTTFRSMILDTIEGTICLVNE